MSVMPSPDQAGLPEVLRVIERLDRNPPIAAISVQSCIPFIDLLQYIPESKNLIDGTSVLSKPCLLLPQDVVNFFFNSAYQHSAKDLTYDW